MGGRYERAVNGGSRRDERSPCPPKMEGIYAGQPGRKTARPSAELLLGAMKTISVSVVEFNGQTYSLLSPLTDVQKRLLELWGLPPDLYEKVARGFPKQLPNTSEP